SNACAPWSAASSRADLECGSLRPSPVSTSANGGGQEGATVRCIPRLARATRRKGASAPPFPSPFAAVLTGRGPRIQSLLDRQRVERRPHPAGDLQRRSGEQE